MDYPKTAVNQLDLLYLLTVQKATFSAGKGFGQKKMGILCNLYIDGAIAVCYNDFEKWILVSKNQLKQREFV